MPSEIKIRRLEADEFWKLAGIYEEELGDTPPAPNEGIIVVAEQDGIIVGVGTAQWVLHCEPFWVARRCRGRGVMMNLAKTLAAHLPLETIRGLFCMTAIPRMGTVLKRQGFKQLHGQSLFRWTRS